jgi:hypothetical protein
MDTWSRQDQLAEAQAGVEMETFRNSTVGRYLTNRANIAIANAQARMEKVDPEDARAVRAIQQDLLVARTALDWIEQAVQNGRNAAAQLD